MVSFILRSDYKWFEYAPSIFLKCVSAVKGDVEKIVNETSTFISDSSSNLAIYVLSKNRGSLYGSFAEFFTGMSPVATEERRMLPLGGGLKRSASFVISVDEVEVLSQVIFISMMLHPSVATLMVYFVHTKSTLKL